MRRVLSLIIFTMKIWTMSLIALVSMSTNIHLIIFRMVFLFLPTMTLLTFILVWASIFVAEHILSWFPILTLIFSVEVELRFSSIVLPIMSINTNISLMSCFIIWTPHSFEMKHIEVNIFLKFVNKFDRDLSIRMSKWAIVSILTFVCTIDVWWAEFSFVLVWMVKFFNSIMSLLALITLATLLSFNSIGTHLWLIGTQWSTLVFLLVVVEGTSL